MQLLPLSSNPFIAPTDRDRLPSERRDFVRFLDPGSQALRSVGGVRVLVGDGEESIGVRARDADGQTVRDCPNVFLSCPLVVSTLANGEAVNLRFPGEDIVTVEFIDEGKDGFTLDDLSYVRPVPECAETP